MKKSVIAILIIALMFVFVGASCDSPDNNKSLYDTNNQLSIVHICDADGNCVDYNISVWYETSGSGIGFRTTDGNYIWCSEGTYIMASDYCPICGRK